VSDPTTPAVDLTGLPPEQAFALDQMTHDLIVAAEVRGYRKAIDALQDGERIAKWLGLKATGEENQRGAISYLRPAAAYLEAITLTAERP
jgi:hypothetical protein